MGSLHFFLFYYVATALRYLFIAGPAFLIFYIFYRSRFAQFRIQKLFPKKQDYYRELIFSFLTFVIFSLIGVIVTHPAVLPHTKIYTNIPEYGWGYFGLSILLALLIHDTYFYWTHRLMHHPWLFRAFHLTHHRSTNPSPWAAFAFSPLEAVVEGSITFVIVFLIPIHTAAFLAFLIIMTVFNVMGHLGYEIFPAWLVQSPVGKWLNTSTNHNMHHKFFRGNYGLYFRFWDELLRTTHPQYDKTLQALVTPSTGNESVIANSTSLTSPSARKNTTEPQPATP
jgi:Delta7-sterol 5-desaturase